MKRLFFCISLVALMISCGSDSAMSTKMNHLVGVMESNKNSWSPAQMDKCQQEFEALITTFNMNYDYYSPEERAAIQRAIIRYQENVVRNEIGIIADDALVIYDELSRIVEDAPGYIDQFADKAVEVIDTMNLKAFQNSLERTGKSLEDAISRIENKLDEELGEE
ncbi:MAG: hypothetical protein IJ377_00525 [Rikenellaceae bacterium]|nr:hypothetical protein [Rikenellaceae bacterium]